ncbi:unnamed protein product [Notodromas monacha]|uniref:Uncharacterized protein n=1 Tax=Notodromas monacha TaxID=399045 RepID=A0A7R9BUM9_9CRUS|nr:unnamed protein product [Notodromas monacha]CAG0920513.1 unnamed protein product [Notodromas monacha]
MTDCKIITSPLPKRDPGLARDASFWSFAESKIKKTIADQGEKPLWIDGSTDEQISNVEFLRRTKSIARILREEFGVKRGSVVLFCSKNDLQYYIPVYATFALGAIAYQIPTVLAVDGVERCLSEEKHVPVIFCDDQILPDVEKCLENHFPDDESPEKSKIVIVAGRSTKYKKLRELLQETGPDDIVFPELNPRDVCAIFVTSGTTGPPKSAAHTHYSLLSATYNSDITGTEDDWYNVKLFHGNQGHIGAFYFFLCAISTAGTSITFSNYDENQLLATVERYKATCILLYASDSLYLAKLDKLEWSKYDLSSVKMILTGASIFQPMTRAPIENMFPNLAMPIAQVVNLDDGGELGPDERGEIWIHTPFIIKDYRNRPDLTSAAITFDGWYKTGDYGFYDIKKRLHIVDRVKDLIRLDNGVDVSPSEIENIILQHPSVKQVGVTGVEFGNEKSILPRAFIVLRENSADVKPEEIVKFVQGRAEDTNLCIRGGAEIVETLVTYPGGKIYRRLLRENYAKRQELHGVP